MIENQAAPESPFTHVTIGAVVTRFGECATRVHHARYDDSQPEWFDPRAKAYQGAQHREGYSVYWEVKPDWTQRDAEHPFNERIAEQAQHIEQMRLI